MEWGGWKVEAVSNHAKFMHNFVTMIIISGLQKIETPDVRSNSPRGGKFWISVDRI